MVLVRTLLVFILGLYSFASTQKDSSKQEVAISISASPLTAFETQNPSLQRFGSLEFRGGLVLTSTHKSFGGISALLVQRDGEHFIALSDRASWLRGRIVYRDNRPAGIADAVIAPVLDADGEAAPEWDTESMAQNGNTLYVGLERLNRIIRFDYGKSGVLARGQPIDVPPELKDLPFNQGLEALVFVKKKNRLRRTLIALSEHALDGNGNLKAFLIAGQKNESFSVKRTLDYDISDAALLPDDDLLILERCYSLQRGVSMRIRRIRLVDIKPGALVDGPVIIEGDSRHQIDNMEALSVHRTKSGKPVLTLMSDDNFSQIQRTLLLQFVFHDR